MSKLDELIQELCPDGVEYKTLEEVAHYAKERIPASGVDENTYVGVENLLQNKKGKTVANAIPTKGSVIAYNEGDILIGNIRPYLRKVWLADCNGGTNGDVLTVQLNEIGKLEPCFLYYVLSSEAFFQYDIQNSKGAKMPRGSKDAVMKYPVPVPPLEVQREIVHILDYFTLLTAELTAELTARKKQYEYYRNELLVRNTSVDKISLDEVAVKIASGKNKERLESGEFPVYGSTGIIARTNTASYEHEQILVARVGANAGYVHLANGKYDVSDNTLIVDVKDSFVLKYVYYMLVNMNLNQYAKGGGQPLITAGDLKKLMIPMPQYEVQERIVEVLDNFEKICTDLNIGLPAEIEARQKQYEFYRDQLLTFAETGSSILTRQDKTRQDKTRQDKTRQDKTRQDKTRQDKT
jgi:type I restriction enzyme S subunit